MPDAALLADAASPVAPAASDAASDATLQPKKELVETTDPVVWAVKEHRRARDLCRILEAYFRRTQQAKEREFDRLWLALFESLLDFPGASGLDTPFFLFLQNLHFVPGGKRLWIASPPGTTLNNPLLIDMYGPTGPLRPFRTVFEPEYHSRQKEPFLEAIRKQLQSRYVEAPLRVIVAEHERSVGTLVSHMRNFGLLADTAHLALREPKDPSRTAVFYRDGICVLTSHLLLFPRPSDQAAALSQTSEGDASSHTTSSSSDPSPPSSSNSAAHPLAKKGAVSYLRITSEPKGFFSSDFFWSLFASFDEVFVGPFFSSQILQDSPALERLLSVLPAHRLSLFPVLHGGEGEEVELEFEVDREGRVEPAEGDGEATRPLEGTESVVKEEHEAACEGLTAFSLPPATSLAIHYANSPHPHHLLTPLDTAATSSCLTPEPLRLTVDSKILGNTHKATVFSATARGGVKLVVKYSTSSKLRHEAKVLAEINRLAPDLAPKCYGIFGGSGAMYGYWALVLEHGGDAVPGFRGLTREECTEVFSLLTKLHLLGFEHNSFASRNVVRDSAGRFRLIDFERTECHTCEGVDCCMELDEAQDYLDLP